MCKIAGCGILLVLYLAGSPGAPSFGAQAQASASAMVQQGLAALQANRFSEAEGDFSAALKANPHWPEVRADLGVAYYADHKFPQAIDAFEQALKENPALQTPKLLLPLSLAAAGRCEEAEAGLRTEFAASSDVRLRRVSGLSLQRCLIQDNKLNDADAATQKLLEKYPNDPDVLYEAGQFYAKLSSSIDLRLMHVEPHAPRTYQLMGNVASAQGNWDEAIHAYRQALQADPALQGVHLKIAVLLLTHSPDPNAWRQALTDLNDELRVDPGNAEVEYEIGEVYRKHDQPQPAVAAFQESLARDPNAIPTRIGLAKALQQLGKKRQALATLLPAEQANPSDPSVRFLLAQIYRGLGDASHANLEEAAFERLQKSSTH